MTFSEVTLQLLGGFGTTCLLFLLTLALAMPLGLLFAFCSKSKIQPLKYFIRAIIWVVRGTPLMLQLIVVMYTPGLVFGDPISKWAVFGGNSDLARFCAALFAFTINYACYFSEIFRAGIQSVSIGQHEAGAVLGMTKVQTFFKVVLFQVVRNVIPPLGNEIVTLVKDTALANIIMVTEIIFVANDIMSSSGLIWPLFYAGIFYLVFNAIVQYGLKIIESKMNYYKV